MASAYQDRSGWTAVFRGFHGKPRKARIPKNRAQGRIEARAYADECDRYCRILEQSDNPSATDLVHALRLKAITLEDQRLISTGKVPLPSDNGRLTLYAANKRHPSTRREAPTEQDRHSRGLDLFQRYCGIRFVDEVTLDLVQDYIESMSRSGFSWDTRRHRLLPIRRACKMGTMAGIPDQLAGLMLDRRETAPVVEVWTLPELLQAVHALDGPARAAVALGGFIGLRPSEIERLQPEDRMEDVLQVGARQAKNTASRRALPLPAIMIEWLQLPVNGQKSLGTWLKPILAKVTGRELPVKCLRKSFATWAIRSGIPVHHVEAYLGHKQSGVAEVTGRHYLADMQVEELRPVAARINLALESSLAEPVAPARVG